MDFAGLGDSAPVGADMECHLYATDRRGDFTAAIEALTRLGFQRFAAAGLCTGAYHALNAAAADERLRAVALINLVTFQWHDQDAVDVPLHIQLRSSASYWWDLGQRTTWRRLLRGEVDIRSIFGGLGQRTLRRIALAALRAAEGVGVARNNKMGRPRRMMRMLSQRGTRVLLLLAAGDPGVDALEEHFGRHGRRLAALPGATVIIDRQLDHTLATGQARDHAVAILADYFARVAEAG
jgi:hypothetical protein